MGDVIGLAEALLGLPGCRVLEVHETIDELVIAIDYKGAPRRGLYFVGPDEGYPEKPTQAWTQGQDEDSRYWFPCFDAPHEKATSEGKVTVPASMHFPGLRNPPPLPQTMCGTFFMLWLGPSAMWFVHMMTDLS